MALLLGIVAQALPRLGWVSVDQFATTAWMVVRHAVLVALQRRDLLFAAIVDADDRRAAIGEVPNRVFQCSCRHVATHQNLVLALAVSFCDLA
ncbi:hypothetical protein A7R81_15140 [Pseudomonas aeruginosa]|nr:hypothetical protein A7R81_15140 [Pseudomonas aeruginosa]